MKLKFINLLLASVLFAGSAQVFTSCKDNEADIVADLKETTITLSQKLDQDHADLTALKAALQQEILDRTAAVQALANDLAAYKNQVANDYATKVELTNAITDLTSKINANLTAIQTLQGDVNRIDAALTLLEGRVYKNEQDIITINTAIGDINLAITGINNQIDQLTQGLAALGVTVDAIEGRVTVLETTLAQVQADLTALEARVGALETDVTALNTFKNTWEPLLPEIQTNAATALATANQNAADIASLQAMVAILSEWVELGNQQAGAAIADLQSQITSLAAQVANCATLAELEEAVRMLQAEALAYYNASIGYTIYMCAGLRAYIEDEIRNLKIENIDINNNLVALDNKIDTSVSTLQDKIDAIEQAIETGDTEVLKDLNEKIAALNTRIDNIEFEASQMYNNILAWVKYINTWLEAVQTNIDDLWAAIGDLNDDVAGLDSKYDTLNDSLTDLWNVVNNLDIPGAVDLTELTEGLATLNGKVDDLTDRVDAIEGALEPIRDRIEEVAGRINSIIIQQTDNAVFGTLNLPVGISSNMLLAYASDNAVDAEFPTTEGYYSYNGRVSGLGLEDGEVLPLDAAAVNCSPVIMELDEETGLGVLGTIYLTVNPANVDLKGKTFNIVNSRGEVLPIQIAPVASDKELNFGYTRAGSNGFYEAKALINPNDISKVRFVLDSKFKSTVAGIVKHPKEVKNPSTIAQLASAFYGQINGVLPALGLQASWTESDGTNMLVTSQYGLAVATFNPLALSTLVPFDDGKLPHLRDIPDLSNLNERFDAVWDQLTGKLNIQIYDPNKPFVINLGEGIKISISTPTVSFTGVTDNVNVNVPVNTTVTVPIEVDVNVYDPNDPNVLVGEGSATGSGTTTIDYTANAKVDLSSMLGDMQDAVNQALKDAMGDDLGADLSKQVNDQLTTIVGQIETQVNDMLSSMQGQIDSAFSTIKNFVDSKLDALENRLGRYTDRVQALINRINAALDQPSHYVQPILLYRGINGNLGRMSTAANMPTVLVSSVEDPGIVLMPTTYTLETVVPLYQKYVAVTKVWKNGDASRTNVPAVQNKANNGEYMNAVVNAQRHLIACELQKGYTYEIYYQGLDFSGKASGDKYYVCVK